MEVGAETMDALPPHMDVVVVGILSIICLGVVRYFVWKTKYVGEFRAKRSIRFHSLDIKVEKDIVAKLLSRRDGTECLVFKIGCAVPEYYSYDVVQTANQVLLDWKGHSKLTIKYGTNGGKPSYEFSWESYGSYDFEDHFEMSNCHWYGAGRIFNHTWPMETWQCNMGPFVTGYSGSYNITGQYFGGLQERLWLTSSGLALHVDPDCPLFAKINHGNDHTLVLASKLRAPFQNNKCVNNYLKYTIIQAEDVRSAFFAAAGTKFDLPEGIPDEKMFRHPIWSTWAQYKTNISEDKIIEFARKISQHKFKNSQLEIDDGWASRYGDWEFDQSKFKDPKRMINELKGMGYRITLWVHPFANISSKSFMEGIKSTGKLWVEWKIVSLPMIRQWWNGLASILDVTSPPALAWFEGKLKHLQNSFGVHSFKFDAGEGLWLSSWTKTHNRIDNPNEYTKQYVQFVHQCDKQNCAQEVIVGHSSQKLPMFFRLSDKDSNWGTSNGLKTLIPQVLTQGLIGYPFVLPDMIGGNAYGIIMSDGDLPDRELFIRWTQATALLPAMQFSIVPWQYDDEVVRISRKMCELHERYSDRILALAQESTENGSPIIRPLWWISPKDETALTCSSQFLLGDDTLVAPVLEQGARSRDIYLPNGTWRDELHNNIMEGNRWHMNYPADIDELPIFSMID